jgi:hypothetical protein
MNRASEAEEFCIRVATPLNPAFYTYKIIDSLNNPDDPTAEWDYVRGVDILATGNRCPDISDNNPVWELRFYIADGADAGPPCAESPACAQPLFDLEPDPAGHPEYTVFRILAGSDWLTDEYRRTTVNHELGHVFGLCDQFSDYPCSLWSQNAHCSDSIMHSCPTDPPYQWPSSLDITSVEVLIPTGGSSQGGSAATGGGKAFGGV